MSQPLANRETTMAFIDTYRNAVKASANPVVAYAVGSFGSFDALLRYSICPIAADGTLATTLAAVAYVFMANVVARGDFKTHPDWMEACKTAKPRLVAAGLGGVTRSEDEMLTLQRNVLSAIPTEWLGKARVSVQSTVAAPVAASVAEAVDTLLTPTEATSATVEPDSDTAAKEVEAAQIAAATAAALAKNGAAATGRRWAGKQTK
jgi:hypothetical protein